jgi:hypothetical protein
MHLDATPASPTANSYVRVEVASDLLAGRRHAEPWFQVSPSEPFLPPPGARQAQCLIWATQLLDEQVNWFGVPLTREQALAWPQTGQVDQYGRWVDQHTIPLVVQRATAFYALALLRDELESPVPSPAPMSSNASASGPGVRISYRNERIPIQASLIIPAEIRHMLRFYGACTGSSMVPLRRC